MIGASMLTPELQAFQAEVHSRQTVLSPSRPKYVPSERSDGPGRP